MDEKQLESAAKCAQIFCSDYKGPNYQIKAYEALKALSDLTLADLQKGKLASECSYNAFEINEQMTGQYNKDDNTKKKINRYFDKLKEYLPTHIDYLSEIAKKNALSHIPGYDARVGGGSGNTTQHYFIPQEPDSNVVVPDKRQVLPQNTIHYHLEKIDQLPTWARWIDNFELSGWRLALIAISLMTVFLFMIVAFLLVLGAFSSIDDTGKIIKALSSVVVIELALFWLISFFKSSIEKRIIPAPVLLLPSNVINAQLECIATDKIRKSTGRNIRKYRLVSYAGVCPICNSRVELESGGKEFHNRLVGKCLESPDEHIFSFDRMTKLGFPLRTYFL